MSLTSYEQSDLWSGTGKQHHNFRPRFYKNKSYLIFITQTISSYYITNTLPSNNININIVHISPKRTDAKMTTTTTIWHNNGEIFARGLNPGRLSVVQKCKVCRLYWCASDVWESCEAFCWVNADRNFFSKWDFYVDFLSR